MRSSPPGTLANLFFVYGASVLSFLFFCVLAAAAGFFFRAPISSFHFLAAAACTLVFAALSCAPFPYRGKFLDPFLVVGLLLLSFALAFGLAAGFFDLSYDGQAYHQEALIQLNSGWNPFYRTLAEGECNRMGRWLQHYSKGVWIYQAAVYKLTGDIEAAKGFHLWLIAASFSLTLSFFLRFRVLRPSLAVLTSLLVAFNPVSIYQSLSFYLDGQHMSLIVILVVTIALLYREPRPYYYALLFMVISVLVNVKLTSAMYTVVFLAGTLLFLWIKKKRHLLRPLFLTGAAALLTGLFLFGFSPYLTNTLQKGNPFYPALGTDRSDYTNPQFPANFQGRDPVSLFFFSIFAKSDNVRGPSKRAYLKIPFTVSADELEAFTDTNAKQGGFGPLFGGAFLVSFLIAAAALRRLYFISRRMGESGPGAPALAQPGERSAVIVALFSSAVLFASCLINPASSLARFIPQMWLFPIFTAILAFSLRGRFFQFAGHALLLILVVNNCLIGATYYAYNGKITKLYDERLKSFAATQEENPLIFHFGHFRTGNMLRFDRFGIRYVVAEKKENCYQGERILPASIVLKCEALR